MIHEAFMLALTLLAAHWVADYPLQGDFLATAKANGPMRVYHLIAHSGIHGGAVALVTGSAWIGLAEFVIHALTDEAKVRGRISYITDQGIHIACKAIWMTILLTI